LITKIPGISSYIDNLIKTNKGIQLPAVLDTIFQTFKFDGVSRADVDDPNFVEYVRDILGNEPKLKTDVPSSLGKNLGTDNYFSTSDRDPFNILEPQKS